MEVNSFCDVCGASGHVTGNCPDLQTDLHSSTASLARQTLPSGFDIIDVNGQTNIRCLNDVPPKTKFGPLVARLVNQVLFCKSIFKLELITKENVRLYVDMSDENDCNWLCLIAPASTVAEQNCIAFQLGTEIYYSTVKLVKAGEFLKVWYAAGYAKKFNKPEKPDNHLQDVRSANQVIGISNEDDPSLDALECQFIYACPICGDMSYSSQQDLEQHMTNHDKSSLHVGVDEREHGHEQLQIASEYLSTANVDSATSEGGQRVQTYDDSCIGLACRQCSYQADSVSALAQHIRTQHLPGAIVSSDVKLVPKKRVWTCTACGVVFSNPRSLGTHKRTHHPLTSNELTFSDDQVSVQEINVVIERREPGQFEQPLDLNSFGRGKRKRKVPKHLESSVVEVDGVHDCPYCPEIMNTNAALQEHMRAAHSYHCKNCGVEFSTEDGRDKHLCKHTQMALDISIHKTVDTDGSEKYCCPCCQQIYEDPKAFYSHVVWHCKTLPCDICKGHCVSVEALEEHVKSCGGPAQFAADSESIADTFSCNECNIQLCDISAAEAHLAIHSNYKCNKCSAHYCTRFGLQQHLLQCDKGQLERVEPVFACLDCSSVFSSAMALHYHNKDHTEQAFECIDCHLSFKEQLEFETHDCQPKESAFSCDICAKGFKTNKALASHYLKHTMSFNCQLCKKAFESKDDLIGHSLECSAKDMLIKLGKINCALCEESFTDSVQYRTHLAVHTMSHQCKYCNKKFSKSSLLVQHWQKCRPKLRRSYKFKSYKSVVSEGNYECPVCHKLFVRKDYYLSHQCRGVDGKLMERPDGVTLLADKDHENHCVCYQCGKVFVSQSNLNKHLKLHGEKEIFCDVCGKSFYQIHAMRLHYDSVHTDKLKVKCEPCNRVFRNKYSLHTHLRQFHAPNITVYACDVCGKKFRQKGNMQKHMLAHDVGRHYNCDFCTKTFKYPEQLKRHALLHTQGKALQCEMCDRRFVMQYELNKHMKEMHSNKLFLCSLCNETCRWRHTIRRHIKRKHPRYASLADDGAYLTSLMKDTSELDRSNANKQSADVSVQQASAASTNLAVIAMDTLTAEQIVELGDDHLIGHVNDENNSLHLYSQPENFLSQSSVETLQRLVSEGQQHVSINNQQFTISFSNGHTILTPVDIEKEDSGTVLANLLRSQNTEINSLSQSTSQGLMSQADQVFHTLSDGSQVLMTSDGTTVVYTGNTLPQSNGSAVSFPDVNQLTQNSSDDSSKMMFFNLLATSQDSQS